MTKRPDHRCDAESPGEFDKLWGRSTTSMRPSA